MRFARCFAAVALLVHAPACRGPDMALSGDLLLAQRGLEQVVQLVPAEPAQGEQLHILSVVTNRGRESVAVESRICGMDLGGNVALVRNYLRCAGYSQSVVLAPGDTVSGTDMGVVSSPPGHYTLRVRQLVQPDAWVTIPVEVR